MGWRKEIRKKRGKCAEATRAHNFTWLRESIAFDHSGLTSCNSIPFADKQTQTSIQHRVRVMNPETSVIGRNINQIQENCLINPHDLNQEVEPLIDRYIACS